MKFFKMFLADSNHAVSFSKVVQDATTELFKTVYQIYVTSLLRRHLILYNWPGLPLSIRLLHIAQSKWAAIFPQKKATTAVCLAICMNPSSMPPSPPKKKNCITFSNMHANRCKSENAEFCSQKRFLELWGWV